MLGIVTAMADPAAAENLAAIQEESVATLEPSVSPENNWTKLARS